jgi:IclR family pca regulon transcriptional regulator
MRTAAARSRTRIDPDDRSFVSSLARGLQVMQAFAGQDERLRLSDVAALVGLSRATVRRCLLTLESLGYIRSDGAYYFLTPQVLTLAHAFLTSSRLPRVAQTFVERVCQNLGASCSVSVLDGDELIYVARAVKRRVTSLHLDVGSRLPAYCSSMGRILLAFLPPAEFDAYMKRVSLQPFNGRTVTDKRKFRELVGAARSAEFCLVDQELDLGLRSIAIPLRNASNQVVAALNVSTQADGFSKTQLIKSVLPVLRNTAADMRPLLVG